MTQPGNREAEEPVTVTDKRRIDPQTGEVREGSGGRERSDSGIGASFGAALRGRHRGRRIGRRWQGRRADRRPAASPGRLRQPPQGALRDQEAAGERAKAVVVSQLLPVIDDLDRARSHGDLESGPLKSVADKLAAALNSLGLVGFGTEGEAFDPSLHEAVQHEGDGSNPVIGHVMRKGYKLGELVLRPAMVGVVDAVEVTDSTTRPAATSTRTRRTQNHSSETTHQ